MLKLALKTFQLFLILLAVAGWEAQAQPPMEMTDTKPVPEERNLAYGPGERHVLDLWKAKSESPTPLLIFFHGGGFAGGDKWNLSRALLDECLKNGISVASANYRLSRTAAFPAPMLDGARAIQFLRYRAAALNLDPKRFCATGSSAGAGISMWVAFHDDLADPANADPVLRESSRLKCVAVYGGQSSYDPRFVKKLVGGRAYEHPALLPLYGLKLDELDTEKAYKLYEAAAAINYITADDPPLFGYYSEPWEKLPPYPDDSNKVWHPDFGKEVDGQPKPGKAIHHPNFGVSLKEKLEPLGIACELKHRDDYPGAEKPEDAASVDLVGFVTNHL